MISATYFGEITDLDSRAVWYSDEEDEDDELESPGGPLKPRALPLETPTHESIRANINSNFKRLTPGPNIHYDTCVVSLISSSQFKNFRIPPQQQGPNSGALLGYFDVAGKAVSYSCVNNKNENLLWLVFDIGHRQIAGQEVGYFVEKLRDSLQNDFVISSKNPMIILSQQFASGEHLEYLNNMNTKALSLPFDGRSLQPPALIRNQFESALFEQSTLVARPAVIVCLPAPKNFWFNRDINWPTVPMQIIESRLTDDSLEKTLIFT